MRPLKPGLKTLAWSAVGLVALPALIWLISLLYWHFAITYSLKRWKQAPRGEPVAGVRSSPERGWLQSSAGCRALPYAVAALESSDDHPEFQEELMNYLISVLGGPGPYSPESFDELGDRSGRWSFIAEGLNLERRDKVADFLKWWSEHGRDYHTWWKTWSRWCVTPDGRR